MVAAAITRLRASGFSLAADGDRLKVIGPTLTDAQRAWLATHKAEILMALDVDIDAIEERAAIIFEGHTTAVDADGKPLDEPICTITVEDAEAMARAEVGQHPMVAAALVEFPGAAIVAIRQWQDRHNDPHDPDAWAN